MKILLIDPPFYKFMGVENRYFPIGLGYVAAPLSDQGHLVRIYSADASRMVGAPSYNRLHEQYQTYLRGVQDASHFVWRELLEVLQNFRPDVVGITAMTPKMASVLRTATLCKTTNDRLQVVIGGPHATVKPEEILRHPHVDFVIRGEGENSFGQLARALERREGKSFPLLPGLSFRRNGEIFHTRPGDLLEDLDRIPFPARHLLWQPENFSPEDLAILMTSRGCPYGCTFCYKEMFGKRVRYRSVGNVVEEIKFVMKSYGARQFAFKDDSFTVNQKRVREFCDALRTERLRIGWECTTRVDLIEEDLLKRMMAAGCNTVKVGVESGSERIQGLIKKGISLQQVRQAARLFAKHRIFWAAFFMAGLPGETEGEMEETLKLMKEIRPDYASIGIYEPYPGTELFQLGIDFGLVEAAMEPAQFFKRAPDEYYLKDPGRRTYSMEPEKFEAACEKLVAAFDSYNKGIGRLWKMGFSRRRMYWADRQALLRDLRRALKWMGG